VRRRLLYAGSTPRLLLVPSFASGKEAGSNADSWDNINTPSIYTIAEAFVAYTHSSSARTMRLREPLIFISKTLKEAQDFIQILKLNFALALAAYPTHASCVLFGVIYLGSELKET